MAANMAIVLVEDNNGLQQDIKRKLESRYLNLVTVHGLEDWPAARIALPELVKKSHLILSDMNLMDFAGANPPGQPFLRTAFDGLRVFGFAKRLNPSIPVILYTAHDLAQNALDQLDDPDGPVWVIIKKGWEEIQGCADRLAMVAESMIWTIPLRQREAAFERLSNGDQSVLEEAILADLPSWKSVLAVLSARSDSLMPGALMPSSLRGLLGKFLPSSAFKLSLLARMFKPRDYEWSTTSEAFGISAAKQRVDDIRAAWEQLLHPREFDFKTAQDDWIQLWEEAIGDAKREFDGSRHALLTKTFERLRDCLKAANELERTAIEDPTRFGVQCNAYADAHTTLIHKALKGNWRSTLDKLFTGALSNSALLDRPFWAEWQELSSAINYVCVSSRKHSGKEPIVAVVVDKSDVKQSWRLRIAVSDDGPGISEFSSAFIPHSDIRPDEAKSNHKLQLAQGLLWGYCHWLVLTKLKTEREVKAFSVFSPLDDRYADDEFINRFVQELTNRESGTVQVLDFICPVPLNGSVQNEVMDLRFKG